MVFNFIWKLENHTDRGRVVKCGFGKTHLSVTTHTFGTTPPFTTVGIPEYSANVPRGWPVIPARVSPGFPCACGRSGRRVRFVGRYLPQLTTTRSAGIVTTGKKGN